MRFNETDAMFITQQMIETMKSSEWHRLIYIRPFVNPMVQERHKFGPLG
jgi:hypothetical protein